MSETTQSPYDSLGAGKLCVLSLDISVMSIRPLTLMFEPLLHCHHHLGGPEHNFRCFFFLSFFSKVPWLTSVPAAGFTRQNVSGSPAIYVSSTCGIRLWWLFMIHMISLDPHRWKEFHPVDDQRSEWVFHPDWSRHFQPLITKMWIRVVENRVLRSRNVQIHNLTQQQMNSCVSCGRLLFFHTNAFCLRVCIFPCGDADFSIVRHT